MRNWLDKMSRKFQNFMIGRYGTDELSRFLLWVGIICMFLSWIAPLRFLYLPAWIVVIWAYIRVMSKNIIKRSKERDKYLRMTSKVRARLSIYKKMWKDRHSHRYFKCPNCKTFIRVPKGKGKIVITCTKCRNEITKTT